RRSFSCCPKDSERHGAGPRMLRFLLLWKGTAARASVISKSSGSRGTFSSSRAGSTSLTKQPARQCCSLSPIGPFRKFCTSSARNVTMPENKTRGALAAVQLRTITDEILAEVEDLPPELINWIPEQGVWSIMDILCHIREFVPFWTGETLR